jgi:hypothetical protein
MNKVDEYLKSLKDKENQINMLLEAKKQAQYKISEINDKIIKLNNIEFNLVSIGVWNKNLMFKKVVYDTCIYDTEEHVVDSQGGYEYFTDISKDILIESLNKTKDMWENIIKQKESEINELIK